MRAFYFAEVKMRKVYFTTRGPTPFSRYINTPLPYFIPVSSSSAAAAAPSAEEEAVEASAAAASATVDEDTIYSLQQLEITETSYTFFNPYYYTAESSFELGPKEVVVIHFDLYADYSCSIQANYAGLNSCMKKNHFFFLLQNSSNLNILHVSRAVRLLDILIMSDIKSCMMPVKKKTFSFNNIK